MLHRNSEKLIRTSNELALTAQESNKGLENAVAGINQLVGGAEEQTAALKQVSSANNSLINQAVQLEEQVKKFNL